MNLTPDTTVRDILQACPAAFEVFLAHGMCESCQSAPPPVPLAHFSDRHEVDLEQLVNELEACFRAQSS
jgi:hypothetical protein